jgi:HKD family nuclease
MNVQIVDNGERKLLGILTSLIEQSTDIRIAVAFASRQGVALIRDAVDTALQFHASVEFLLGLDMQTTEPAAVRELYELSRNVDNVSLYCFATLTRGTIYHPKMYLLRGGTSTAVIVGSSNLTKGGLTGNVEVNVVLEGTNLDEPISDAYVSYNRLKFMPDRVVPDDELLALYEELRKKQKQTTPVNSVNELLTQFTEKARSLHRPTPTRADLVGWLELVYDAAPEGEFTNRDIYQHLPKFRSYYPDNNTMQAKIRQKLQELRNMGFLTHVGVGRWRKV